MIAATLTFDGSSGPTGIWTCMGWAYLIELPNGRWTRDSGRRSGAPANNMVAEFEGLIRGLKWFTTQVPGNGAEDTISEIILRGDSKPLIDLITGGKTGNELLTALCRTAGDLLDQIDLQWKAEHIPKRLNKECNGLAQ